MSSLLRHAPKTGATAEKVLTMETKTAINLFNAKSSDYKMLSNTLRSPQITANAMKDGLEETLDEVD